jgi:molybdopterin synthase sulfur carrier subunit
MSITVRYFASLKESLGRSEDHLARRNGLSVNDVWLQFNNSSLADNVLVAVNMDYVERDYIVQDGDEVAFFPPVTGG